MLTIPPYLSLNVEKRKPEELITKLQTYFWKTVFTYQYGAKALSACCVFVASIFQHQGIRKHGVRPRQPLCCRRPRWFSTSDFCFISQGIRWVHTTLSHGKCDRNCAIFNIQLLKNFSHVVSACYWYFLRSATIFGRWKSWRFWRFLTVDDFLSTVGVTLSVTFHYFNWSGGRFCSSSPYVFYSPSCRFFGRFGAASLQRLAWHSPWHDCHGWRGIRPFVLNVACREFLDFFPAVQNKKPCKTSHMLGADWRGSCAQDEVVSAAVGIWVIFCLRIRWPILLLFSFVLLCLVLDCMQIKCGITLSSWDGFVS